MCRINNEIQTLKSWTCSSRQICNTVIASWQQQRRITNRQQIHHSHATHNPLPPASHSIHSTHQTKHLNHSPHDGEISTKGHFQGGANMHHVHRTVRSRFQRCIIIYIFCHHFWFFDSASRKRDWTLIAAIELHSKSSSQWSLAFDTTNNTYMLHCTEWIHGVWRDTMQIFHRRLRGGARGGYWYWKAVWDGGRGG